MYLLRLSLLTAVAQELGADCSEAESVVREGLSLLQTSYSHKDVIRLIQDHESREDAPLVQARLRRDASQNLESPKTIAEESSPEGIPAVTFLWIPAFLLLVGVILGAFWHRDKLFPGLCQQEEANGKPVFESISTYGSWGNSSQDSEATPDDDKKGTMSAMPRLPPTAGARTRPAEEPLRSCKKSLVQNSPRRASNSLARASTGCTDFESIDAAPPPLVKSITMNSSSSRDSDEADDCWTISYDACQSFLRGQTVEVQGPTPLHATYSSARQIVIAREPSLKEPVATLGPISSPLTSEAQLFGPGNQLYGDFLKKDDSYVVRHREHSDPVLTLNFTKVDGESYLEVESVRPICLVGLPESSDDALEIDADPTVDNVLLIITILACLVCNPKLVDQGSSSPSSIQETSDPAGKAF
jgi:hypothetical protein